VAICRRQRGDGDAGQDRHAVGIGDDPPVPDQGLEVHLRRHQRTIQIHPEGRGVVDHHRAGGHRQRGIGLRCFGVCGEEHQVDAVEAVGLQHLHGHGFASIGDLSTGGPRRGQQLQARSRETPRLQALDQFGAHGTGGADDGDSGVSQGSVGRLGQHESLISGVRPVCVVSGFGKAPRPAHRAERFDGYVAIRTRTQPQTPRRSGSFCG
jgi:hypothetical protein